MPQVVGLEQAAPQTSPLQTTVAVALATIVVVVVAGSSVVVSVLVTVSLFDTVKVTSLKLVAVALSVKTSR